MNEWVSKWQRMYWENNVRSVPVCICTSARLVHCYTLLMASVESCEMLLLLVSHHFSALAMCSWASFIFCAAILRMRKWRISSNSATGMQGSAQTSVCVEEIILTCSHHHPNLTAFLRQPRGPNWLLLYSHIFFSFHYYLSCQYNFLN